ncbi:MAG: response regulator [Verrucomicrobia bacterium]|nr:response regulator [Verrucomicrobiota bacterium]
MKPEVATALEATSWPVLIVDRTGVVRAFNAAATTVLGETLRADFTALQAIWFPQNEVRADVFLARLDGTPQNTFALKFRTRDGTFEPFTTGVCSFFKDGQKNYLFQLLAPVAPVVAAAPAPKPDTADASLKQKLTLAMQLTRTISMDFNNALTSILGHTTHVLGRMEPTNPWRPALLEVEKAAAKAATISHDLSTFSRQEKDPRVQADGNLNDVIRRVVEMYRTPANFKINWQQNLEGRLYTAKYEDLKMQQAIAKVIENSAEALAGQPGTISIISLNRDITGPVHDGNISLAVGSYVCVEVSDTGPGIPPEVLPRVIEPFFTTKPAHRGLGLAWVYGVVTNHGGHVAISSEPGHGTSVRLYLPARKTVLLDTTFEDADFYGNQPILMVDDAALLLTMGQMVLSSYGYHVFTADCGQTALEIFTKMGPQIDLVITDLVMPNMSGRELVERLRALRPDVRIVRSSGNFRPSEVEQDSIYLQKPFTSQDLLRVVKQALQS